MPSDVIKCQIEASCIVSSTMLIAPPCSVSAQVKRWKDKHYLGHIIAKGTDNWHARHRCPKVGPADDSQTAFGPWNVQRPFSDIWTSNGAQLCQSNSSGYRIYWLAQAKRETRGESKTRFSLPYQFLLCQSCSYKSAREKRCVILILKIKNS